MKSTLVQTEDGSIPRIVFRTAEEWGFPTADIAAPPKRLLPDGELTIPVVDQGVDAQRLTYLASPATLLSESSVDENVSAMTRRSLSRLQAYFLICEDPQRRLDAREVSTLAHQISLVRHILDNERLRRVLIADEVGLGKTVEAGLLLKELLTTQPRLRVLYLAPARLVSNVRREFDRLELGFRQWSAEDADARLTDSRIIASIHRAVHPNHRARFLEGEPWDILVVDECHHLSDWAEGGGDPREKYKLVRDLIEHQGPTSRLILLSGTPHQGHSFRFENLLAFLVASGESTGSLEGRVIFRTKDDIVDWDGNLLFPRREVNPPIVVDLGDTYRIWIQRIFEYFTPGDSSQAKTSRRRAAGWRCAQALQWAASSPQAGLGYLVRQAIRTGMRPSDDLLAEAVLALRPYRNGPADEPLAILFQRIQMEIGRQATEADIDDIEDSIDDESVTETGLRDLLQHGLRVVQESSDAKWNKIYDSVVALSPEEKFVFFAQPIETVTAFASFLERRTGERPALIIGGQSDGERDQEVKAFCRLNGPRFLVSSRAGGEGINLQVARRLVHIDVPWNPMDMEQRVGRVHRFGSRRNIIVDTLVVKDSREEHAYRVARERLKHIVAMLVSSDRFDSLFSRVMSLMPPEELQDVLINGAKGPLTEQDQESLARMVQEGYENWRDFDQRFAKEQQLIRSQSPGLAAWDDVNTFLCAVGKAESLEGFVSEKFALENGTTAAKSVDAPVIRLADGKAYACCDLGGLPAYRGVDEQAFQLGLNIPPVQRLLSQAAFPDKPTGAASIRWPDGEPFPFENTGNSTVGLLVFNRVTIRFDQAQSWVEQVVGLRFFLIAGGASRELTARERRIFMDGLSRATVRAKKPINEQLEAEMVRFETQIVRELQRPTEEELSAKMRHAVAPLLACTIEQ